MTLLLRLKSNLERPPNGNILGEQFHGNWSSSGVSRDDLAIFTDQNRGQ